MESKNLSIAGFLAGLLLACYGVVEASLTAAVFGSIICWVAGGFFRS